MSAAIGVRIHWLKYLALSLTALYQVLTAIYGFLVVFWGAAIVLFLARIINLHNDNLQNYWIELSSQVTNGLFTVTGIGLIPQRTLDTYRE